jgi:hypothetical protein
MRSTRTQLACGAILWLLSGAVLWQSTSAWGQTAPVLSGQPSAGKPGVTVERQGRLLVLNYGVPGEDAQSEPKSEPNSPPGFAIYEGQRKIASGQFEYG